MPEPFTSLSSGALAEEMWSGSTYDEKAVSSGCPCISVWGLGFRQLPQKGLLREGFRIWKRERPRVSADVSCASRSKAFSK